MTTGHPRWCIVAEAHSDEDCLPAELSTDMERKLGAIANLRTRRMLENIWKTFGPLSYNQLSAAIEGAQQAVMEWTPPSEPTGVSRMASK